MRQSLSREKLVARKKYYEQRIHDANDGKTREGAAAFLHIQTSQADITKIEILTDIIDALI